MNSRNEAKQHGRDKNTKCTQSMWTVKHFRKTVVFYPEETADPFPPAIYD